MIEVEIKVQVTDDQAKKLINGAQLIATKSFVDSYYDSDDYKLTINGLWLRKRDEQFELKIPATKDGSFHLQKNIPMHEITDDSEIMDALGLSSSDHKLLAEVLEAAGIKPLYQFSNTRTAYRKNGFTIDFDQADFGDLVYCLCEVEILVESKDQAERALESLYTFVKQYGISTERAEGKLGHYIRVKNPAHYQAVVNSAKHHD